MFAGTHMHSERIQSGLVVANLTGYLACLSSLNYALLYALYDFSALKLLVIGNVISAILTAMVPFMHRYGRTIGALMLSTVLMVSLYYFISILGRESGIQLNYIAAGAIVLGVLGHGHLVLGIIISIISTSLHILVWILFPHPQDGLMLSSSFLDTLYIFSAISIVFIIFMVIYYAFTLVKKARDETNNLLLNILPKSIATRLIAAPDEIITDTYEAASVIFADMTGFTKLTGLLGPEKTTHLMNDLFSTFDNLAAKYSVEKIKTIGDCYMAVSGVPEKNDAHAANMVNMAIEFLDITKSVIKRHDVKFGLRIGIASGPLTAGIIGKNKFAYDIWGETVNLAARLEAASAPGQILVNGRVREILSDSHKTGSPQRLSLKGIGEVTAWKILIGNDDENGKAKINEA